MGNPNADVDDLGRRKLGGYPEGAHLVTDKGQEVLSSDNLFPVVLPTPRIITVTPTVDTNALATGDLAVTLPTLITGASRGQGRTTVLKQLVVLDEAVQSASLELWFFDTPNITFPALNAAWSISDAHSRRVIGVCQTGTYFASSLNSISIAKDINLSMRSNDPQGRIWFALIARGAPTYAAATDLTFTFTFYPDA